MDDEYFKNLLMDECQRLERELSEGKAAARPVELDQSSVGRLSRMDAMQSQAMSAEAQRRRQAELSRVRAALRRVADGSYGDCLECGDPVQLRRLQHNPAQPLCIECAEARNQ